jgi:hypothetical protein
MPSPALGFLVQLRTRRDMLAAAAKEARQRTVSVGAPAGQDAGSSPPPDEADLVVELRGYSEDDEAGESSLSSGGASSPSHSSARSGIGPLPSRADLQGGSGRGAAVPPPTRSSARRALFHPPRRLGIGPSLMAPLPRRMDGATPSGVRGTEVAERSEDEEDNSRRDSDSAPAMTAASEGDGSSSGSEEGSDSTGGA